MEVLLNGLSQYLQNFSLLTYGVVFVGGVLTSFTPCIYPLIPVTIGVIGSQAGGRKSSIFLYSFAYVLGISTTYAALGGFAALTGKLFGRIAAHPLPYIIVGNICILLGLSSFEVISLPFFDLGAKIRKTAQGKKGFMGMYLIGLASGLVVGPCTSAILGALLAFVATKQNLLFGITLLFTFALGMCVLLLLLGIFSGLLKLLPHSGPWMKRINYFFGFALIGLGEYFLIIAGRYSI